MKNKILIYSMGRSGGGNLVVALSKLLGYSNYIAEPFNQTNKFEIPKKERTRFPDKIEEFIEFIEKENIRIVKHNLGNFTYLKESEKEADYFLFDQFENIIINGRRNMLAQVISQKIAGKTGFWHSNKKEDLSKLFSQSFKLNLDEIEAVIENRTEQWKDRVGYLLETKDNIAKIEYENFFEEIELSSRVNHACGILKMLLNESPSDEAIKAVMNMFSEKWKMNNKSTYSIVENIDVINKKLGPKYGFLY